jgi:tetratricopeptide (TPR) repeat protein
MTPLPLLLALGALCAPQDPALDKALATAAKYATQNNFQAALAALEGAGANTSDDPVARTQYGVYRMRWLEDRLQRNDPEVAGFAAIDAWNEIADAFAAVTRLPGANDEPWEHWSECLLNASDLGQALSVADDGVSEHRDSVRLQLQRGRVLMALARKAAEIGRTEEETKRYDEAEAAFRTAMEKGKKSAAPCLRLAELKITRWAAGGSSDAKLRAEAVALWTEAVQREPGGVDLGATYAWLGADAVAPLDAFLEAKPDHLDAIWFRGLAHWAANPVNWPGARDDLMKVVEKNPTFYDAYFYLGDAAMRRGEELSAAQSPDADDAYRAAAKFWAAYLEPRATVYAGSLRQSADAGAGIAQRLTWLAWKAGFGFGQNDQAAAIMRCVVQVTPEDGFAWSNLGLYLRDHAERLTRAREDAGALIEEARAAYARAYALLPEDPQVMNDYAVIHHYYLHDEDEMVKDLYRRAMERAQKMLDEGGMDQADQVRIGTALQDATNNLRKLEAGNRRNG